MRVLLRNCYRWWIGRDRRQSFAPSIARLSHRAPQHDACTLASMPHSLSSDRDGESPPLIGAYIDDYVWYVLMPARRVSVARH